MSPKKFRKISHPELEISLHLSCFSKEISQLKDWQTYKKIQNYLEKVYQHPRNVSNQIKNRSYPELEISQYSCDISKKVSQITDSQTYKKIRIIWNKCTKIPLVSPKRYRKLSYPELEISQYSCTFRKKVNQLTDWQT